MKVNNNFFRVNQGTACLVSPYQAHTFEDLNNAHGIVLFFCQDFYVEEFSFIRLLNIFSCTSQVRGKSPGHNIDLNDDEFTRIADIVKLIQQEYERSVHQHNSPIVLRSLLNILLLRLSDLFDCRTDGSARSESVFIHELSRIVDSYFINEHNISFYTSAFNVSEKQLNEICNKHFNCGLKKILTDRLMQEARKLLLSSELSVSEISYKLNFDDNSYFNKVFKKEIGLTPKRFRTLHRQFVP